MQYRSEIDGLRAFAVIPVIFFHAGFDTFSGGYVGVDVFFVISGFLITSIIQREIKQGKFSLVSFYERRMKRILPALFVVMFFCTIIAWYTLIPSEMVNFSQSLIATSLFSSNILFWRGAGYFATASELTPLLHTWSLAVEEQFYIFFPLFLLALKSWKRKNLVLVLFLVSCLSLLLSEWASVVSQSANFFLLPTRVWELGVGALAATVHISGFALTRKFKQTASILGLLLILTSVFMYSKDMRFPGFWAIPPVLGAVLIVLFADGKTLIGRLLSMKFFVMLGLISYSTYLWHQPIFAFFRVYTMSEVSVVSSLYLILLTLGLAYITWYFIENPVRKMKNLGLRRTFLISVVASALFVSAGIVGLTTQGFSSRFTIEQLEVLEYSNYDRVKDYKEGDCFLNPKQSSEQFKNMCFPESYERGVKLLIWGDSHAAALSAGLRKQIGDVIQLTASLCPPVLGYSSVGRPFCGEINQFIFDKARELKPNVIFLHANWLYYTDLKKDFGSQLVKSISLLKNTFPLTKIVIIGGVPQWGFNLPQLLVHKGVGLDRKTYLETSKYKGLIQVEEFLKTISLKYQVSYVSLLNTLCENDKCLAVEQFDQSITPLVWDTGHLMKPSSAFVSGLIIKELGL